MANWDIDSTHSSAHFSVKHLMISNVRGEFSKVTGKISYDPSNIGATKIEASIDASTVNTREEKRDEHLKSPDFLDTAKFPAITFKSTSVEKGGDGLKIHGDLTLHGVTKPVALDAELPSGETKDPWGGMRIGVSATTKINRRDFGLAFNQTLETGGLIVGDHLSISIDVELTQSKA
jgi:polyisoprenoid-binding protein YceI